MFLIKAQCKISFKRSTWLITHVVVVAAVVDVAVNATVGVVSSAVKNVTKRSTYTLSQKRH